MLTLIKLHRSANPDASTDDMTRNVKRKFLNGISSQLRRSSFIFCQDPHSDTITTEKLLEAARKTKLHLMEQTDNTVSSTFGNPTVNTVHPASTPVAVDPTLSWRESPSSRSRFTARGCVGRVAVLQVASRHNCDSGTRAREGIKCWNCGEKNHFARDCQASPLNE